MTIFWRGFRKDKRFLYFDEPLTGDIGVWFPSNNSKHTQSEYFQVFGTALGRFWALYSPIHPLQEPDASFTIEQERYLRFLLNQSSKVVIDETHLHLHLGALAGMTPDAYVIHLNRRASAFAPSHFRPSWSRQTN